MTTVDADGVVTDLAQLREPFPPTDIEWRIGQSGKKASGEIWAKVLAYITNRAIMDRLDSVCGPENWKNEFRYQPLPENGLAVLCGLSIRCGGEWVTKWDGAENTDIEAVKGGLSNAMKRAAVHFGIGRYLYDLPEGWAQISENGENYVGANKGKEMPAFRWNPPQLPKWALPVARGADESGKSERTPTAADASSSARAPTPPEKAAKLSQKNIVRLLEKAGDNPSILLDTASEVLGVMIPSMEAKDWPTITATQYDTLERKLKLQAMPDSIQLSDTVRILDKLLVENNASKPEMVKRIETALRRSEEDGTLTQITVERWIQSLKG